MNISNVKKNQKRIQKPFLTGRALGSFSLKRSLKVFSYHLVSMFIYLFLGQTLIIEQFTLRLVLNLSVLLIFALLLYSDAAHSGENDVSFSEIAYVQKENGKVHSEKEKAACYHPMKGFVSAFLGVLPFVLIGLALALVAEKQLYKLGSLPSWISAYERNRDVEIALSYYHKTISTSFQDVLRILIRLLLFPYVNIVGAGYAEGLLMLERFSPLLLCIMPVFYGIGYLQGPKMRAKIHGDIAVDAKRRVRREKAARKKQAQQEPKQII